MPERVAIEEPPPLPPDSGQLKRKSTFWPILVTIVVDRFWRRVMIFVALPFWLAWLMLFSYDPRNQAMVLPMLRKNSRVR